jgi:hypothetical protein
MAKRLTSVGGGVFVSVDLVDGSLYLWHTCSSNWKTSVIPDDHIVSRDPLHIEPSIKWDCCGKHGFIRDGQWEAH